MISMQSTHEASDLRALLSARQPVVFMVNGFGDHILGLPTMRALHQLFPGRLTLMSQEGADRVFYGDLSWAEVIEIDVGVDPRVGRTFDLDAVSLSLEGCDCFISLITWHNAVVERLANRLAPRLPTVGFFPSFGHYLPIQSLHSQERTFVLPSALDSGLKISDYTQPVYVHEHTRRQAQALLDALPRNSRLLVFHNETLSNKMYPKALLKSVLTEFMKRHPDFYALSVALREQGFEGAEGDRVLEIPGLPLTAAFAVVQGADLFLGTDSVFLHVADLSRIPSVGIFGPSDPLTWGFRHAPNSTLVGGDGTTSSIGPNQILDALEERLAASCSSPPA